MWACHSRMATHGRQRSSAAEQRFCKPLVVGSIPTAGSSSKCLTIRILKSAFGRVSPESSPVSEFVQCSAIARPLLAYCERAACFTLRTMSESMKQQFGLIRRPWGVFYLKNKTTGVQISLKTRDKQEAQRLPQAENDALSQEGKAAASRTHSKRWRAAVHLFRCRRVGRPAAFCAPENRRGKKGGRGLPLKTDPAIIPLVPLRA